jgi:hypothetical protein
MSLSVIDFVGFFEPIPFLLIGFLLLLSIVLAYYTYSGYSSISIINKVFLILLRAVLFVLIGFILLNPVFERVRVYEKKPTLAVLLDQSSSTGLEKGEWRGETDLNNVSYQIKSVLDSSYELVWFGFDSDIYEINPRERQYSSGTQTDIAEALSRIANTTQTDEILLVSDGIVTRGRDPIFVAQSLSQPIHSIAVGDTSRVQDLIVTYVEHSAEMVTDTEYTILVGIRNEGFNGQLSKVELKQENEVLESREVRFNNDSGVQQVRFNVSSDIEGLKQFEVAISPISNEWSIENNNFNFTVNFVDNRVRILYLTYQFHPDVSIIKQILFEYPEISIQELTWTGNSFTNSRDISEPKDYDVVIIHGVPESNHTSEIERIRSLIVSNNTILFAVPGVRNASVYSSLIGFTQGFESTGVPITWTQAQIQPNPSQSGHPVLNIQSYNWSRSPLVTAIGSGLSTRPGTLSLMESPQSESIPVLSSTRLGNYRSTVVTVSGLQAFYLNGTEEERALLSNLVGNLVTWSASDINQNLFEISTDKSEYSSRDDITFNARVTREDGSPEVDSSVRISLDLNNNESREFALVHSGNGNYELTIPGLPSGNYSYSAIASRSNFDIGSTSGAFQVGNPQQELINTQRNDALLQQISTTSGGLSGTFRDLDSILEQLSRQATAPLIERKEVLNLYKHPFWFILALVVLTTEWLLRRKLLLP